MGREIALDTSLGPLMRQCQPIEAEQGFLERMLKRNDRAGYAAIVSDAHAYGADAYLIGGVLNAALDGRPREYSDVDLLVVTPDGDDLFLGYVMHGARSHDHVLRRGPLTIGGERFRIDDIGATYNDPIEAALGYRLMHETPAYSSSEFDIGSLSRHDFEEQRRYGIEQLLGPSR